MKRNPRKERWTKAYRRLHYKDMTQGQDGTFEFEWKRNRPERLWATLGFCYYHTHKTLMPIEVLAPLFSCFY
nr:probable ribosome biogenesis protein RLP24 [Tanacetum cinerariifolium]